MGLRNFRDKDGREWRVWDVYPYARLDEERRRGDRRQAQTSEYTGPERRSGRDRRRNASLFTPGLEAGWLCFENHTEKRRLTPVPWGWDEVPEDGLDELLERARPVTRRD